MQLFFSGAESQSNLDLLRSCGVERVAVSVANLARHTRDYAAWVGQGRLKGLDWLIYADAPTTPVAPLMELLSGASSEPESVVGPVEWATETWLSDSDIMFLPIWDGRDGSVLRHFVEMYDGTVLPDSVCDNQTSVRTARASMNRLSVLGGLTGRTKGVDKFDLLISSAWYATTKHGETQIWTGDRMVRLNSDDKHLKRQRYAQAIEALGLDVAAVLADDPKETSRLAVLSWLALERHINVGNALAPSQVVTNSTHAHSMNPVPGLGAVANAPIQTRQKAASMLPIMQVDTTTITTTDAEGNTTAEEHEAVRSSADSMRQCNTCALSAACPGYQPQAKCSYSIPVVIRTKDQRQAVLRTLIEIQTQRILMGTFSEQVNGQADAQVGKEMDRLFTMVERWKSIEETTQKFSVNIAASGADTDGSLGMISRLFGSEAGTNARALDVPIFTDELVEDMIDQ